MIRSTLFEASRIESTRIWTYPNVASFKWSFAFPDLSISVPLIEAKFFVANYSRKTRRRL